jgi:hypothetical protein
LERARDAEAAQVRDDIKSIRDASFIFSGRVRDIVKPADDDELGTAVVEVEAVHFSPQLLADAAGQPVAVGFSPDDLPDTGSRRLFFTNPVEFSERVLAYSVEHVEASDDDLEVVGRLWDEEARRRLTERVSAARVIVHGVVTALRRADAEYTHSEHDPDWWIAALSPRAVLKGDASGPDGRFEVAFANSRDIRWANAPKLAPGQEAIIFARADESDSRHEVALAVVEPGDVLDVSAEQLTEVRELIG